jgi:hypothetical protein
MAMMTSHGNHEQYKLLWCYEKGNFSATCLAMALRHKLQKRLHGATLTQVAAIVVKIVVKIAFGNDCCNLSCNKIRLNDRQDGEMFHATCVATPFRNKLQRKFHRVSTLSFAWPA